MTMTKTDEWWASLTIAQKERVAGRIVANEQTESPRPSVVYPACTAIWMALPDERKEWIYDHCTNAHGLVIDDWTEGYSLSY